MKRTVYTISIDILYTSIHIKARESTYTYTQWKNVETHIRKL